MAQRRSLRARPVATAGRAGAAPAVAEAKGRADRVLSWKKDPGGRRERVLLEATRLFSERSYAAVSTGDIARAAGVSEGSVFHYFGSKPDLLRAVGERYGSEFAAAMFSGVEPVATVETIEQVITRAFGFVAGNWTGFGLFLLSDDPSGASLAQRANRVVVTRGVERVLDAWSSRGALSGLDASVMAELIFGLVEASLRACFTGPASERTRYVAQTVTAISRMLGIDPGIAPGIDRRG